MKFIIFLKRFFKSPIFSFSIFYFIFIGILSRYTVDANIKIGVLDDVRNDITKSFVKDLENRTDYFKYIDFSSEDEMYRSLKSGRIKTSFTIKDEDGIKFYEKNIVESPISGIIRDNFFSAYFKIYALNMGKNLVKNYTDATKYEQRFYKYLNGGSVYSFKFLGNTEKANLFPLESLTILGILVANLIYIYDLLKIRDTSLISLRVSRLTRFLPIVLVYILAFILLITLKNFQLNTILNFLMLFLCCFLLYVFCEKHIDTTSYMLFTAIYILGFIATSGLIVNSKGILYVNISAVLYLIINSFEKKYNQ